jgi:single stranded DNA-binding protein
MNTFVFNGRLGKDPELKRNKNDNAYCTFSVAESTTEFKDGKREKATNWHNCMARGSNAENICEFFKTGKPIALTCEQRQFEGKDGVRVYMNEVRAWTFLEQEPKPKDGSSSGNGGGGASQEDDDDIQFS